jgi:hypothetical protein
MSDAVLRLLLACLPTTHCGCPKAPDQLPDIDMISSERPHSPTTASVSAMNVDGDEWTDMDDMTPSDSTTIRGRFWPATEDCPVLMPMEDVESLGRSNATSPVPVEAFHFSADVKVNNRTGVARASLPQAPQHGSNVLDEPAALLLDSELAARSERIRHIQAAPLSQRAVQQWHDRQSLDRSNVLQVALHRFRFSKLLFGHQGQLLGSSPAEDAADWHSGDELISRTLLMCESATDPSKLWPTGFSPRSSRTARRSCAARR